MSEVDLRCYYHPDREATSQCDRCGDYLCSECVRKFHELYLCARCLKDVRPRGNLGNSARIACVICLVACSLWMVALLLRDILPFSESSLIAPAAISMGVSVLAVLLAFSHMRGRDGKEQLFRWSVVASAGDNAIFSALGLMESDAFWGGFGLACIDIGLMLLVASVVLSGASVWKRTEATWALTVALLAPLMLTASLILLLARPFAAFREIIETIETMS